MTPLVAALVALVPVAVGILVARTARRIGWLLVAQGLSFWLFAGAPGSLVGRGGLVVDQVTSGAWVLLFAFVVLIAYLLPDGHAPSPAWRRWMWVTGGGIALVLVGSVGDIAGFEAAHPGATPPVPWLPAPVSGLIGVAGLALTVLFIGGAVVAVRWRLARAGHEDRLRLFWLVWGALSLPLALVGAWITHFLLHDNRVAADLALSLAAVGLPVAIGIAVLRHRLFDVQVVLSGTLTYAVLSALVAVGYGFCLWGAGRLFGDGALGGLVAVVVVASVATPLYGRLRARVERWVYGYRSDPATALRRLGARVESAETLDVLEAIASSVADALRVPRVHVEAPGMAVAALTDAATVVRVPLVHRGERVGDLAVGLPPGRRLSRADLALLSDLARQAAVTVHAARLAAELQASRSRIVAAREEERRRLRRDLHDGVGPSLAAIVLQLDAVLSRRDAQERNALISEIRAETQSAITEVRRLVDDLRPPAIDEVGLVGAIRQRAAALSTDSLTVLVIGPATVPPLPAAVESAAFRIASEAVTNAARHSGAAVCTVEIRCGTCLELVVSDNGHGRAGSTRTGVGSASMTERAAEIGGSCTISERPEGGLVVHALLPLAHDMPVGVPS